VGAPVGALLLRILLGAAPAPQELRTNAFFYIYELVGSCVVFGVTGFVLGRRADVLRRMGDRYRELAEHDPLTGLVNARSFFARYRRAVEHARRFREPLSLLVIDVDRLKEANDTFGHAFGSAVLLHVAQTVSRAKREDDMAARWGGDEFALLMPGAEAHSARARAEAIHDALRRAPLRYGDTAAPVSVTIGVATRTGELHPDEPDLFERADAALYEGKRVGRGQVRESL
jgi:diguanylate cyclase (GGDEF)-like protein